MNDESKKKPSGGMTDIAKKVLLTGLGAIFMTEEGIRKAFGDIKLPKEAVNAVVETVKKQKDDIINAVASELGSFLSKVKLHEEVQKALAGMQVRLEANLTFDQKGTQSSTPKLSVQKR